MRPHEDRQIIQSIRRELVRRQSIDGTAVQVHCVNGVVELSGDFALTPLAEAPSSKDELNTIKDIIMRLPGVRDVVDRYLRVL